MCICLLFIFHVQMLCSCSVSICRCCIIDVLRLLMQKRLQQNCRRCSATKILSKCWRRFACHIVSVLQLLCLFKVSIVNVVCSFVLFCQVLDVRSYKPASKQGKVPDLWTKDACFVVDVLLYVCMYVCMYLCMYVCILIYIYIYIHMY